MQSGLGFESLRTSGARIDGEPQRGSDQEELSVSSLKSFVHVLVAMKVKFVLEQPSSTGVGHELARSCTCYSS